MKYSLISISLCCILFICSGCTHEYEIDSKGETNGKRALLAIHATANSFENFPAPAQPSTRIPMEDGLDTKFNPGDTIGIFAIKNGRIVDAVNNIKLTYVKTSLTEGCWNPPTGTVLYHSEGTNYIAYYPYKENISIDATQSPDEIITSLTNNTLLKPATDQSDPDKYTACDLMTAIGELTNTTDSSTKKILKLNFTHQFTLLILKPQAYFKYVPPTDAVFTYRDDMLSSRLIVDITAKQVMLNGVKACKMDDGSYRAIILPQTNAQIAGSYITTDINSNTDKNLTYSGSSTTFSPGNCYTLTVKSPLPSSEKVRELTPGDFVFFNKDNKIEIYPGDGAFEGETIPDCENAVGMVITCAPEKMTDPKCKENGWTHAYVLGLDNIGTGRWGVKGTNEDILTQIPLGTVDNPLANLDKVEGDMNGYSETEAILEKHANEANFSKNYSAFKLVQNYREKKIIPYANGTCSPWFIPSVGQWFDMLINICGKSPREFRNNTTVGLEDHKLGTETLKKFEKQMGKVNKEIGGLIFGNRIIFWSSTEYNEELGWIVIWHFEMNGNAFWDRIALKGYYKDTSSYHIFPFFAF